MKQPGQVAGLFFAGLYKSPLAIFDKMAIAITTNDTIILMAL